MLRSFTLKAKAEQLRLRLVLSRFIAAYFFLAFAQFAVQVILQSISLSDDIFVGNKVDALLTGHNVTDNFSVVSGNVLQLCQSLPTSDFQDCIALMPPMRRSLSLSFFERHAPDHRQNQDDVEQMTVNSTSISDQCAQSLPWIEETFHDGKREDVATLFFQLWLLIMSVIAILTDSIPHLIAALMSHTLDTAWAAFNVHSQLKQRNEYITFVVADACDGVDVLNGWWDVRLHHSIPILIVNSIVLILVVIISWRLFIMYERQTFNSVGASAEITRIHKIYLAFWMSMQLASFFILAGSALWINRLTEHLHDVDSAEYKGYLATFVISVMFEVIWVALGWYSIRLEARILFWSFIGTGLALFGIWTAMFFSPLYRFYLSVWPFFATMTVTAYIFLIVTFVLAICCRANFGKGLDHYLGVISALASDNFTPASFSNHPDYASSSSSSIKEYRSDDFFSHPNASIESGTTTRIIDISSVNSVSSTTNTTNRNSNNVQGQGQKFRFTTLDIAVDNLVVPPSKRTSALFQGASVKTNSGKGSRVSVNVATPVSTDFSSFRHGSSSRVSVVPANVPDLPYGTQSASSSRESLGRASMLASVQQHHNEEKSVSVRGSMYSEKSTSRVAVPPPPPRQVRIGLPPRPGSRRAGGGNEESFLPKLGRNKKEGSQRPSFQFITPTNSNGQNRF